MSATPRPEKDMLSVSGSDPRHAASERAARFLLGTVFALRRDGIGVADIENALLSVFVDFGIVEGVSAARLATVLQQAAGTIPRAARMREAATAAAEGNA